MNQKFIILIFIGITFYSCKKLSIQKDCKEISRIEVYSMGISNINFPISQSETDIRRNPMGVIFHQTRLKKVKEKIDNLKEFFPDEEYITSITSVGDIFCENGTKYILLFDKKRIRINGNYYQVERDLIEELFIKKPDKLLIDSSIYKNDILLPEN